MRLLHVGRNDLILDDTFEEMTEYVVNIATSLKTEINTVAISNIAPRGDSKKEKVEAVNKLLSTCANKKKYLW